MARGSIAGMQEYSHADPSSIEVVQRLRQEGMDEELERFKRMDLRSFAAAAGFAIDHSASTRRETVMRRGDEKISVTRAADGHYIFSDLKDSMKGGSIIDFALREDRTSLSAARSRLRDWFGSASGAVVFPPLEPVDRQFDRASVQSAWHGMRTVYRNRYLERERRIPWTIHQSGRFLLRTDQRGNVAFPHFDEEGLCGFEKKNRGYTGFSEKGRKGLGLSVSFPEDRGIVFVESGVEALSHATLFPNPLARYASLAGQISAFQKECISSLLLSLRQEFEIVAATNNDQAGRSYAAFIGEAVRESGRRDLRFFDHVPRFKDWNDYLRCCFRGSGALQPEIETA